jgi:hypothetical protein
VSETSQTPCTLQTSSPTAPCCCHTSNRVCVSGIRSAAHVWFNTPGANCRHSRQLAQSKTKCIGSARSLYSKAVSRYYTGKARHNMSWEGVLLLTWLLYLMLWTCNGAQKHQITSGEHVRDAGSSTSSPAHTVSHNAAMLLLYSSRRHTTLHFQPYSGATEEQLASWTAAISSCTCSMAFPADILNCGTPGTRAWCHEWHAYHSSRHGHDSSTACLPVECIETGKKHIII